MLKSHKICVNSIQSFQFKVIKQVPSFTKTASYRHDDEASQQTPPNTHSPNIATYKYNIFTCNNSLTEAQSFSKENESREYVPFMSAKSSESKQMINAVDLKRNLFTGLEAFKKSYLNLAEELLVRKDQDILSSYD